jgi:thiamine-phosphate pyrophosphorylase
MLDLSLYVITDRELSKGRPLEEVVNVALEGGATVIQLREKKLTDREIFIMGMKIKPLIQKADACFIINDRIDLALALDADGVHLGQSDLPLNIARKLMGEKKIIGISVKTIEEAQEAEAQRANYLGVGSIYPTKTKKDTGPIVGPQRISQIRKAVNLPIVGIGGIQLHNIKEVIKAGAVGIAVVSAVMGAPDMAEACRAMKTEVLMAKKKG